MMMGRLFSDYRICVVPTNYVIETTKIRDSHGRGKHNKGMEWENIDRLKLEHRYNLKWNFLLNLAMVHRFCLYIVYAKLELNKPIRDLIYLPNGLNVLLSLPQRLVMSV